MGREYFKLLGKLTQEVIDFGKNNPDDEAKAGCFARIVKAHDGTDQCDTPAGWAFMPQNTRGAET